jgi:hypothetical protein
MVSGLAGRRLRFPAGEKATSANSLTHASYSSLEVRQARLDALPPSSMLPYPTQVIMATGYADSPLEVRPARLDALPPSSMLPYPTQAIMATGYASLITYANGFDGERPGSEQSV